MTIAGDSLPCQPERSNPGVPIGSDWPDPFRTAMAESIGAGLAAYCPSFEERIAQAEREREESFAEELAAQRKADERSLMRSIREGLEPAPVVIIVVGGNHAVYPQ